MLRSINQPAIPVAPNARLTGIYFLALQPFVFGAHDGVLQGFGLEFFMRQYF